MLKDLELTPREEQIMMLLIAGFSQREIAKTLSIKYLTVKCNCSRIYSKASVKNQVRLILEYGSNGENLPLERLYLLREQKLLLEIDTLKTALRSEIGRSNLRSAGW